MNMEGSTELSKLIKRAINVFEASTLWLSFIQQVQKQPCIHPSSARRLPHPASKWLGGLRVNGVQAWFANKREAACRGSHPSAKAYQGFLD